MSGRRPADSAARPSRRCSPTSGCRRWRTPTCRPSERTAMEPFYPLRALVCGRCFLVQLEEFETPEQIFSDYAYFSSYSSSWLEHCRRYAEQMIERFGPGRRQPRRGDRLQRRLPAAVLPRAPDPGARDRARRQRRRGGRAKRAFRRWSSSSGARPPRSLAGESAADLLLGNNVLAHVPDLNDFVAGHEDPAQAGRA